MIITLPDQLARSVDYLVQFIARFQNENINLLLLDQNIDTSTSIGRLMFNMLASIGVKPQLLFKGEIGY